MPLRDALLFARILATLLVATVAPVLAGHRPAVDASALDAARGLVPAQLEATRSGDTRLLDRYNEALGDVHRTLANAGDPYRRARRLHALLHERWLERYDPRADGLDDLLTTGRYNCVSATLFYATAATAVGLEATVLETPRHLLLRLSIDGRDVDVDTVAVSGFDIGRDLDEFRKLAIAYKYATEDELETRGTAAVFEEFNRIGRPVPLAEAPAFLWHNAAQRALERGDALAAANALHEAYLLRPAAIRSSDEAAVALSRAFTHEYEAGRFESAWWIAYIDIGIFPDHVTPRDRMAAATLKRVEDAADRDEPDDAQRALDFALATFTEERDRRRLEREALPRVVASAVRVGRFDLARACAMRYRAVEPDAVEADRLTRWVEERSRGAGSLAVTVR